jgi:hypothetical protein
MSKAPTGDTISEGSRMNTKELSRLIRRTVGGHAANRQPVAVGTGSSHRRGGVGHEDRECQG